MSDKEYEIKVKTSYDDSGLKKVKKDVEDIVKTTGEVKNIGQEDIIDTKKISEAKDELNQTAVSVKKVSKEVSKTTKELDKAERSATEVAQEVEKIEKELVETNKEAQKLPATLDKAAKSAENVSQSANNIGTQGAKGFKNIGYGALQASYFIDDMQYGMKGIMNNIPGLVMGFGGGMGLAGALGIGVVAANQIWNWLDKSDAKAKDVKKSVSETAQEIQDKLAEESLKLDVKYDEDSIKNFQKLLGESILKPLEMLNKETDRNITSLQEEVRLQSILAAKKKDLDTTAIELERQRAKTALIKKEINQDEYELKMLELDQKLSNLGRNSQIDEKQRNLDYLSRVRENQGIKNESLSDKVSSLKHRISPLNIISPDGDIKDQTKSDLIHQFQKALEDRSKRYNELIRDDGGVFNAGYFENLIESIKQGGLGKEEISKAFDNIKSLVEKLAPDQMPSFKWASRIDDSGLVNNKTAERMESFLKSSGISDMIRVKEGQFNQSDTVVKRMITAMNDSGLAYVRNYGADTDKSMAEQLQGYISGVESIAATFKSVSSLLQENEESIDKLDSEIKESTAEIEALKEVSQAKKIVQNEEHGNKLLDQQEKRKERERQALLAKEKERIEKQNRSAPDRTRRQQEAYVDRANIGRHLPNNAQADEVARNVETIIKESLADNQLNTREKANIEKLARDQASSLKMTSEAFNAFMKDVKGLFGGVNSQFTVLQNEIKKGNRELREVRYKMSQLGKAR